MSSAPPDFLVCPITKSPLRREGDFLVSKIGNLKYPIKEGIPLLLPTAAVLPAGLATIEQFKASVASLPNPPL